MYMLVIFLYLTSGQVQPRVSIAYSEKACEEALPLYKKLYKAGKFEDGPPVADIKDVRGRCIPVEDGTRFASS